MTLDVWPPLPLVIFVHGYKTDSGFPAESVDNIIAALERRDRVSQITLMDVPSSDLEILLAAIQEPFPELTYLELGYDLWSDETGPVISELFLGSSAPRLQSIWLSCIPFPGLPKLLLSATRLIDLQLWNIPHSGYISPEAMATTLSTLTSLQFLSLEFRSPQSRPDQDSRRLPPLTRSVLPVLIVFIFRGVSEYLEYLVALIDFPQLSSLYVTFFNQILFDTPQFIQLFNRTPTLKVLEKAHVIFRHDIVRVRFSSSLTPLDGGLDVTILCRELDWQISSLEQEPGSKPDWQDNVENVLWLELLHPFPAVKNLYLCNEFAPRVVPALQELIGVRTIEVLPALQNIFLEDLQSTGPVQEGIQQFIAMRQVTGHPIAVSRWDNSEQDMRVW
ncbi:hypothetical protein DFH94DRAFT_847743 [Russula ochroleuca]|uniref:Uncharacterized protein n=1 Tax=Russula ochroleuca TaxID=152965 RepID=A0A9P5JY14_9AGAM|nr:hypothetical protein DFH94DRAFT_847743 [Russula ochroleuca]